MKINIESPCHEKWENMDLTEKGRFCASCQKEVLDLSNHSQSELKKLARHAHSKLCARISKKHLNKTLHGETNLPWQKISLATSLTLTTLGATVQAQIDENKHPQIHQQLFNKELLIEKACVENEAPKTLKQQTKTEALKKSVTQSNLRTFFGKVTDLQTGEPLAFVNIFSRQNGQLVGTTSDFDGNFEIILNTGDDTELHFNYIGYLEHTVKIGDLLNRTDSMAVEMDSSHVQMVEVEAQLLQSQIILGGAVAFYPEGPVEKTSHFFRRSWWKTKNFIGRVFR